MVKLWKSQNHEKTHRQQGMSALQMQKEDPKDNEFIPICTDVIQTLSLKHYTEQMGSVNTVIVQLHLIGLQMAMHFSKYTILYLFQMVEKTRWIMS